MTVFTICSNNYLAQAKCLGDSLKLHHPDYEFIIILVDRPSVKIDYGSLSHYQVLFIEGMAIDGLDEMINKYSITELNTAVKPFAFEYLFKWKPLVESIVYLDPDILIYKNLVELHECFEHHDFILTPHFFTPIYDNLLLSEQDILNTGLYNLGFIGIKRGKQAEEFLTWWMTKLRHLCYIKLQKGLFVDQIWINFVPLYFDKVKILKHLGYNMAYWNLHERTLSMEKDQYVVNNQFPLKFFHFSGYLFASPSLLSKYQTRYTFDQRPDVLPLFMNYYKMVMENGYGRFSNILNGLSIKS